MADKDNIDDCPICFRTPSMPTETTTGSNDEQSDIGFVYSRTCGHSFCLPCIKKILLAPNVSKRTNVTKTLGDDEHVITNTQGECPMCRADLSYFDLMKVVAASGDSDSGSKTMMTKSNVSLFPPDNQSGSMLPMNLNGAKFQSKSSSFIQFPEINENGSSADNGVVRVFLSQLESKFKAPFGKDGTMQISSYKYLAETSTFTGRVKKQLLDDDCTLEYTVWITFSDNFQFIAHGVCRVKETRRVHDTSETNESSEYPQMRTSSKSHVYPLCRNLDFMRRYTSTQIQSKEIPHNSSSYWGNIFCQHLKVGLASYYFVRKGDAKGKKSTSDAVAYISYDHELTSLWSPLDNGRPIPSQVQFRNIVCPDKRTFRGSICWEDDYNTTWNGMSRWDYEIKFDSKFMCIASGSVYSVTTNESNGNGETKEKMSTFGEDLLYVNAGLYDATWKKIVEQYSARMQRQNELPPMDYMDKVVNIILRETSDDTDRLIREGVTEKCADPLMHVLKAATHRGISRLSEITKRQVYPTEPVEEGSLDNSDDNNPIDIRYYIP